jgi:hypothetical protein
VTEGATTDQVERYQQALSDMADLVGEQGHTDNERRWSRLVGELQHARAELESSTDGRAAIAGLMTDTRPTVRLWSAAAVLFWDEALARPALEELRESPLRYGLHSITAKHTLLEYDAGRLSPDDPLPGN